LQELILKILGNNYVISYVIGLLFVLQSLLMQSFFPNIKYFLTRLDLQTGQKSHPPPSSIILLVGGLGGLGILVIFRILKGII